MKNIFAFLSCVLINLISQNAVAVAKILDPTHTNFTPPQVEQIQNIVHKYLLDNPTVLIEVGQKLQAREIANEKAKIAQIQAAIPKYKNQIFDTNAPGRVVLGNPKGKIIVAEFTQHQCPHCRHAVPVINKWVKANPDVQLIVIYAPFFGNDAVYSSKAVLAAQKQNKFEELEQNKAINSLLWKPDRIIPSLYELRNQGLISKVSEIDSVRQFTTKYTLEQLVEKLVIK